MIPKLNCLVSMAYMEEREIQAIQRIGKSVHWLIDSGAFTNYQDKLKGKSETIPLSAYLHWYHQLQPHVWEVIALDVVKDKAASEANLKAIHEDGLRPMPVFVHGEDYALVPELVAAHPQGRICVAGGVHTKDKYAFYRYQRVWRESKGEARIHALGFVRWPEMFKLPLFTVDSSSWMAGGRMGNCGLYSRTKGVRMVGLKKLGSERGRPVRTHLARCGLTVEQLRDPELRKGVAGFTALSVANAYLELHRHASQLRPAYFFVIPNVGWLLALVSVVVSKRGRKDGTFDYHKAAATLGMLRGRMRGASEEQRDEVFLLVKRMLDEHTTATDEPYSMATRGLPKVTGGK